MNFCSENVSSGCGAVAFTSVVEAREYRVLPWSFWVLKLGAGTRVPAGVGATSTVRRGSFSPVQSSKMVRLTAKWLRSLRSWHQGFSPVAAVA